MLKDSTNSFVKVCNTLCPLQLTESTSQQAVCELPAIATTYSNQNFGIAIEQNDLKTGLYFGTNNDFAKVFDNNNMNDAKEFNGNCYVGMKFKTGFVGHLSGVRYFLDDF